MISGQPPFRAINEYQIWRKIHNLDYQFPDGFSETAKDLVRRLLVYNPVQRLGSRETGGMAAIKNHAYFQVCFLLKIFEWSDNYKAHIKSTSALMGPGHLAAQQLFL